MAAARRAVAAVLRSAAAAWYRSAMLHPAPSSATGSAAAWSRSSLLHPAPSSATGSAAVIPAPSDAAAGSAASSVVAGSAAFYRAPSSMAAGPAAFHQPSSVAAGSGPFHRVPSSMTTGPAGFHHAASFVAAGSGSFHRASLSTLARSPTSPAARLTKATATTGMRHIHVVVPRPIEPHLLVELARLDARVFSGQKEIADAIHAMSERLNVEDADNLLYLTQQVIQIGQVSWRVCTTVITVAVAAGVGVLQLAKGDWELESQEAATSLVTSSLAETRIELEDYMAEHISHKRNVAAAKAFLANQKMMAKESEVAEREAFLAAREALLVARETAAAAALAK